MKAQQEYISGLTLKEKLLATFLVIILLSMVTYIIFQAEYFTVDIFHRISSGSYYVEATKMGGLFILGIPLFLGLVFLLLTRIFYRLKIKTITSTVKFTSVFALLGIISCFVMWPIINHQLDKHNYSYCFFYTQSNIVSPPVYVKDPDYCFMGARSVRKELFVWFDQQEAAGIKLEPFEVKQKIDQLKEENGTDW